METKNAFLAIFLSMAVLFGYQILFPPPQQAPPPPVDEIQETANIAPTPQVAAPQPVAAPIATVRIAPKSPSTNTPARDIEVDTDLYTAIFGEEGGTVKSFRLKNYQESTEDDSDIKELVQGGEGRELPLFFSWGTDPSQIVEVPRFKAAKSRISTDSNGEAVLTMTGILPGNLTATETIVFNNDNYLLDVTIDVNNNSKTPLQGSPFLSVTSLPFTTGSKDTRFLFSGPAVLVNDKLEEVKVDDLKEDGPQTLQGQVTWAAYEDTYFIIAVAPTTTETSSHSVKISSSDGEKVSTVLSGQADIINAGASKQYKYTVYIGPKKMDGLKTAGHEFHRAIDFGWFGFVARPLLVLLNLFYKVIHNYGVAIILVTLLIKLIFWPITQKGMKSMKAMQSVQPKLTKLREKYKDDKERMAQEQMKLYQTHKINPLGGCLPMVLQIPVFFALYRVLMQAIELRHAPFMLWITDLSAPERLYIGFDLPYVGGLPLLTIIMGGSMFLQQKMTPTPAANPEMAKMMMLMPVIFTFLFINFASGLVLYFFVNNMLQMAQQHFINRDRK